MLVAVEIISGGIAAYLGFLRFGENPSIGFYALLVSGFLILSGVNRWFNRRKLSEREQ